MELDTNIPSDNGLYKFKQKKSTLFIVIIILVIFVVIGFGLFVNWFGQTKEKGNIERFVMTNNVKTLPATFPNDIPVESENISQSTTQEYTNRKITLFSVTYLSTKKSSELFNTYGDFLNKAGYSISTGEQKQTLSEFQATKENNNISIIIIPQSSKTMVQISYVVRH
jgi:hypothetical protein